MPSGHCRTFAGKQDWLELDMFFFLLHIPYNRFKEVVNIKTLDNLKKALGLQVVHANARNRSTIITTPVIKKSDQCNTCTGTTMLGLPVPMSENLAGQILTERILGLHPISQYLEHFKICRIDLYPCCFFSVECGNKQFQRSSSHLKTITGLGIYLNYGSYFKVV